MIPWLALAACRSPSTPSTPDPIDPDDAPPHTGAPPTPRPTTTPPGTESRAFDGDEVTIAVEDDGALRTYTLATTHPLRDGVPADGRRTFAERADRPRLRTGSLLFDGLFAMAVDDATQASVSEIADGAFADGDPIPCACFETGERWTYVWTRDTAYAVDLGLAWLDPERAAASLRFKLARPKGGGPLQIVQDTGTGGSWPVSTDRVVWALGAEAVLPFLDPTAAEAFAAEAREALVTTTDRDREAAFDPTTGLLRGETSFLDWREQSYPPWTASDTTAIATSEALGTNVLHAAAWRVRADLEPDPGAAGDARAVADAIRAATDAFWVEEDGLPASYRLSPFDPSAGRHYDHLALALAALEGALPADRARRALEAYPHTAHGPPVIWPQQPGIPIYHNRAIWPFVTAYGLLAAARVDAPAVFERDLHGLARGAALNLSNMENLEFLTGANWVDAGPESGPVVNSRRQLWSVGGYLGAVVHGVWGLTVEADGLRLDPYVTPGVHAEWLGGTERAELQGFAWRGKRFHVALALPADGGGGGAYRVRGVTLDGAPVSLPLAHDALPDGSTLVVTLAAAPDADPGSVTVVADDGDFRAFWPPAAPPAPAVAADGDDVALTWPDLGAGVVVDVYRDGERVATDQTGLAWRDPAAAEGTPCYTLAARYAGRALESPHGPAACWWGDGGHRVETLPTGRLRVEAGGGRWSTDHGRAHWRDWGAPGDVLGVEGFSVAHDGRYRLQLVVGNGAGPVNTGITAANKRLEVYDDAGALVAAGVATAVHRGSWDLWNESTPVPADLLAGVRYRVAIRDAGNMSGLDHFRRYTGGVGGGESASGFVNVAALKLLALDAPRAADPPAVVPDGVDDGAAYPPDALRPPLGAPLAPWSALSLAWDERTLWLTLVSPAFEEDFAPWMVDLAPVGAPGPGASAPYVYGAVVDPAVVPFDPAVTIAARAVGGAEADGGPWPGVYADGDRVMRFTPGVDLFLSADRHTMTLAVPRAALSVSGPAALAARVIRGAPGEEWKELAPATHAPWTLDGGEALPIDW